MIIFNTQFSIKEQKQTKICKLYKTVMKHHLITASRFLILECDIQFHCTWSLTLDVKHNTSSQYKAFTCR